MNNIGEPKYGIIDNDLFGVRIVAGIVTGVRFTEDVPIYEISFGKNSWWVSEVSDCVEDIVSKLKLVNLTRVKETHGLKIKFT